MNIGEILYSCFQNSHGDTKYRKYTVVEKKRKFEHGIPPHVVPWLKENNVPYGKHWSLSTSRKGWVSTYHVEVQEVEKAMYEAHSKKVNQAMVTFLKQEEDSLM